MVTKALSFAPCLNDLTNHNLASTSTRAGEKVSIFIVRCSAGSGERPWKNYDARLVLEDGSIWRAKSFGASGTQVGEVFQYIIDREILTGPSYAGQFVLMTNPHTGKSGINFDDEESMQCFLAGLVIRSLSISTSNWRCAKALGDYLVERNIMGICE